MKRKLITITLSLIFLLTCALTIVGCGGKRYTILLDADGGVVERSSWAFNTGDTIKELPVPEKEGKVFLHWFVESSRVILKEGETINFKANITAKAIYKSPTEIYIGYNLDGGLFDGDIKFTFDYTSSQDYTVPTPIKYGYEFTGWSGFGEDVQKEVVIPAGYNQDLELTANWSKKTYTVTVNFMAYRKMTSNIVEAELSACSLAGGRKEYSVEVPYSRTMEFPSSKPRAEEAVVSAEYVFRFYFVFNGEVGNCNDITILNNKVVFNNQTVGENTNITVYIMLGRSHTGNH